MGFPGALSCLNVQALLLVQGAIKQGSCIKLKQKICCFRIGGESKSLQVERVVVKNGSIGRCQGPGVLPGHFESEDIR